jgi:hypothetical protein
MTSVADLWLRSQVASPATAQEAHDDEEEDEGAWEDVDAEQEDDEEV